MLSGWQQRDCHSLIVPRKRSRWTGTDKGYSKCGSNDDGTSANFWDSAVQVLRSEILTPWICKSTMLAEVLRMHTERRGIDIDIEIGSNPIRERKRKQIEALRGYDSDPMRNEPFMRFRSTCVALPSHAGPRPRY